MKWPCEWRDQVKQNGPKKPWIVQKSNVKLLKSNKVGGWYLIILNFVNRLKLMETIPATH